MTHLYRGTCLPENNKEQVKVKSQADYLNFKNNWIFLECWLHTLWEQNKLPKLNYKDLYHLVDDPCLPDGIYIPDDFEPSEKLKNFYKEKFNYHQKVLVKKWQREGIFEGFKDFSGTKKPGESYLDSWYRISQNAFNPYDFLEEKEKIKSIKSLTEEQKISMILHNSTFMLEFNFLNERQSEVNFIPYKLTKRPNYNRSKKVVKRNK